MFLSGFGDIPFKRGRPEGAAILRKGVFMRRLSVGLLTLMLAACLSPPLWAQAKDEPKKEESKEDLQDLKITLDALKQRLKDQDQRIKELESRPSTGGGKSADEIEREVITKVLAEMKTDADKRTAAIPTWLDNLKFAGDFRLRYEFNGFNWGKDEDSRKKDRNRARFRLRFGAVKTWLDDQLEVGFRLGSGQDNDPTSTNQTFTQDFSKKPVWIDLAYAKYTPKDLKGFSITGGKMIKPWIENEIFWDTDVNPEGFWAEYKVAKMGPVEPFVGAGYFIVNESADGEDSTMYIAQAGLKADITKDVKYTVAANYQEWTDYFASGALPRGNSSPLADIPGLRIFQVTNNLDFPVAGRPMSLFADYAHNCGSGDRADDYEGQDNAFAAGIKYGQNKKKGDWSLKYRYALVEANALPGDFVDSDFGFANRKGHVIGGEYNLLDNVTAGVNVFLTQPVFSPTTTSGSSAFEDMTVTVLADLVWRF
jgi:hypothetical protein